MEERRGELASKGYSVAFWAYLKVPLFAEGADGSLGLRRRRKGGREGGRDELCAHSSSKDNKHVLPPSLLPSLPPLPPPRVLLKDGCALPKRWVAS